METPKYKLGHIGLHFYEEPFISGERGSGTIFFSGCNMRCVYCQNYPLSQEKRGKIFCEEEFISAALSLQEQGAHNINLVTPSHYIKALPQTLKKLKEKLTIPIVYNTSGYDRAEDLKSLAGLVDVYLTDIKYARSQSARKYSGREDYSAVAKQGVLEMKRQQPQDIFEGQGAMRGTKELCVGAKQLILKGVVVRHLVMPSLIEESKEILDFIKDNLGKNAIISLMAQYLPLYGAQNFPEINRRVTKTEYSKVLNYALNLGFTNILAQELDSAAGEYIPRFNLI